MHNSKRPSELSPGPVAIAKLTSCKPTFQCPLPFLRGQLYPLQRMAWWLPAVCGSPAAGPVRVISVRPPRARCVLVQSSTPLSVHPVAD